MGSCKELGSAFGTPKYQVPYYNLYPKGAHNFENSPNVCVFFNKPAWEFLQCGLYIVP